MHARTHAYRMFWEAFPASSGPRDRTTYMCVRACSTRTCMPHTHVRAACRRTHTPLTHAPKTRLQCTTLPQQHPCAATHARRFTYIDADEGRPTLEDMLSQYWRSLPQYQTGVAVDDLEARVCGRVSV